LRRARRKNTVAPLPKVTARINEQIPSGEVRLVDEEGRQLGVMQHGEALAYAESRELDLVEVAAEAVPRVCRVMNYDKWRYEEERRLKASRRNQVHVTSKEVRLRPRIGLHDYAWKRDRALEFLRTRSKVKLVVQFRGREREHPEAGRELLDRIVTDVREFGHAEGTAVFEGRSMTLVLVPNGERS
jgi:translation initiation factor IF-3